MICPKCLEDYQFIKFEVDAETLEHRGVFHCDCEKEFIFPEFLTREIIGDQDLQEQMKNSRLLHLRTSVGYSRTTAARVARQMVKAHTWRLERYIKVFSEQSIRLLK